MAARARARGAELSFDHVVERMLAAIHFARDRSA
jgi:hypothetical protein